MNLKTMLCGTALALAALIPTTTTVHALDGDIFERANLGTCKVRFRVYNGTSGDVTIQTAGDPVAGGAIWINGNRTNFTGITNASIEACGFTNVSIISQNGADGTFASDDYIGFKFSGAYKGANGTFEAALVGASGTTMRMNYDFTSLPPISFE